MRNALIMVIVISTILSPQVFIIQCFEIPTMLTPQNIVCQIHIVLYIINKKE